MDELHLRVAQQGEDYGCYIFLTASTANMYHQPCKCAAAAGSRCRAPSQGWGSVVRCLRLVRGRCLICTALKLLAHELHRFPQATQAESTLVSTATCLLLSDASLLVFYHRTSQIHLLFYARACGQIHALEQRTAFATCKWTSHS